MSSVYQITEYSSFITGDQHIDGYITLPSRTFQQLENFVLSNRTTETDALELMSIGAKKGIGKVITAKNYVGLITLRDGTTLEILPKISSAIQDDPQHSRAKRLLVDMLRTLRNAPYKTLQLANVNIAKMSILEVFIRMFIDETFTIVKRGLKCSYETLEENTTFFRGKLNVGRQIRHNFAHKERSYVAYDSYTVNRSENRLIKATLLYLYRLTASSKNKSNLKVLLNSFAEVEPSTDYNSDFARFVPDRNSRDYTTALMWCRVFLQGKSFTAFSGSEVAFALLFPMETLFESYIAAKLKSQLDLSKFELSVQDKTYHLFDEPGKRFQLRPDIIIRRKADGAVFVLDTKWKVLSGRKPDYGISQTDMYQMYAYQKKYGAEHVTLLYPQTELLPHGFATEYRADDQILIKILLLDLFDLSASLTRITDALSQSL